MVPVLPEGASSNTSPEAGASSLATKLGLGLGIPLVVLAVALLTFCTYRRQWRLRYAQPPPFDFGAPDMAPVSAADFAPSLAAAGAFHPGGGGSHHHANNKGARQQQQQHIHHRPGSFWSEWGTGLSPAGGGWTGTRAAAWGGGASLDDNQVGFVDRSSSYYYNGATGMPAPGYEEDLGSPYEDRGRHTYQVPVVQVHQPQWTPPAAPTAPGRDPDRGQGQGQGQGQGRGLEQPPQRDLARASRGLSVNEEVSPLSSTGSGMPYPRMSAISGMGWETNPRVSRG